MTNKRGKGKMKTKKGTKKGEGQSTKKNRVRKRIKIVYVSLIPQVCLVFDYILIAYD